MNFLSRVPSCPVCGFSSIHTDGQSPCSVRCALKLAHLYSYEYSVPLETAYSLVRKECEVRGLPPEPHLRDVHEGKYRYITVSTLWTSLFWKLDRSLLDAGLNVEYAWTKPQGRLRCRVYRVAPSLVKKLPELFYEYKLRGLSTRDLSHLCAGEPYWHFLSN